MLFYPSTRTGLIALALVALAAFGYLWRPAFDYALLGFILLVLTALADLVLTARALSGKLELKRDFPGVITTGISRDGQHVLANTSRLPLVVQVHEDRINAVHKHIVSGWQHVRPRSTARMPLRFEARQRGELELGGAGLRVLAGLGLWVLQYRFEWTAKTRAYPLIEEFTRGDLFAHRRRLWGIGQHQSRKFGRGTEFDQLREYSPDDEYRAINWNATARAGRPIVNQYRVEQSRDVMLMVDCGRLMHTQIAGRQRLDHYLDAAVQLAYLALSQKDRVGLIAFDAEIQRMIEPASRPRHLDRLVEGMFALQPRFLESDYARAVATLKAYERKRGLVVLFTDLADSLSSRLAVAYLSSLARTHLPVVVILDDPAVSTLARQPATDAEDVFVKAAAEQFISEKKKTLRQLQSRGCIILNVTAERLSVALVNQYLEIKARNML